MIPTGFDRIRSRLAILLTLLLLPIVGYLAVLGWLSAREQTAQARETVHALTMVASSYQRELFAGTERLFRGLGLQPEIAQGGPGCAARLAELAQKFPEYPQLAVTDSSGTVICASSEQGLGATIAGKPYFEQARERAAFTVAAYVLNPGDSTPVVVGSQPLFDAGGAFGGMLLGTINFSLVPDLMRDNRIPSGSRFYILDENGRVLGASHVWPSSFHDPSFVPRMLAGTLSEFDEVGDDRTRRIYVASKIQSGNLTAVLGVPMQGLVSLARQDLIASVLGPIAIWVLAVSVIWIATDRLITRPLRRLTRTARAYSFGDLTARPVEEGPGEIRALARTFSDMASRIAAREKDLQDAIVKRDGMLREIHHRVKNNLQIVTSLLNLQERQISEESKPSFRDMQMRVRSLALVHRYMYESDELGTVNLGAFLKELANSLQLAYGVPDHNVTIEVSAEEVWDIADRAIPLALLMTEAISNALRHAFPEGREGHIRVELRAVGERGVRFSADDNGVGMPEAARGNLGITLIKAFGRQINGDVTFGGPPGTSVSVQFERG